MPTPVKDGTAGQVIPDEIQVLFGKPPLLNNENPGHYKRLLEKITHTVAPKDTIEWFWVKDVTDLLWEIQRLRRFKATIINYGRKDALTQLFKLAIDDGQLGESYIDEEAKRLAHESIAGDPKARQEANALLKKNSFDEESIRARAFHEYIETIETTDRLLVAAEFRRDKILREIDHHRETLSQRLREIAEASNKAIRLPAPGKKNDNETLAKQSPAPTAKNV